MNINYYQDLAAEQPKLYQILMAEIDRQTKGLELIPSENYVSRAVLEALGSEFTNKYSEGTPGKRYYGGQEFTDQIELEAINLAKKLFGADHANVQPHSGAPANIATYFAWCQPGDTILGMDLSHGGHLTHGHPVTYVANLFKFVRYGMKDIDTGEIDFDQVESLCKKHRPKILLVGFSAYPRNLDYQKFASIGKKYNCLLVADMAHIAGLIVGKQLPNPFDFGFHVITTTTHKTLRGPRGGMILSKGIVSNPLKAIEHQIENIPTLIDRMVFPGFQGGPHMNNILAKAVAFSEATEESFQDYAKNIIKSSKLLAKGLMDRGMRLITNGTDNHLILADVYSSFGIDGKIAEESLDKINITVNKNAIAGDTLPPFRPSGIRLGTPAITTRGIFSDQMDYLAEIIIECLKNYQNETKLENLKTKVQELAEKHPIPSL